MEPKTHLETIPKMVAFSQGQGLNCIIIRSTPLMGLDMTNI